MNESQIYFSGTGHSEGESGATHYYKEQALDTFDENSPFIL